MRGRAVTLPVLAALALLLVSCNGAGDTPPLPSRGPGIPAYGDTLVDGTIGEPSNLIPILATDSASHDVAALVYNGLVKYDKDLNLVGDLAEIVRGLAGRPYHHLSPPARGEVA